MQVFSSGATRDSEDGKLQYTQFLSPSVLRRFAEYLNAHKTAADGSTRTGDNWKRGIPQERYLASLLRHVVELWELEEVVAQVDVRDEEREDLLCAIMFNAMGLLYEKITRPSPTVITY